MVIGQDIRHFVCLSIFYLRFLSPDCFYCLFLALNSKKDSSNISYISLMRNKIDRLNIHAIL